LTGQTENIVNDFPSLPILERSQAGHQLKHLLAISGFLLEGRHKLVAWMFPCRYVRLLEDSIMRTVGIDFLPTPVP